MACFMNQIIFYRISIKDSWKEGLGYFVRHVDILLLICERSTRHHTVYKIRPTERVRGTFWSVLSTIFKSSLELCQFRFLKNRDTGGQFNWHKKSRPVFGPVFGPILPVSICLPRPANLPIFNLTFRAHFRAIIYVNWIDPQGFDFRMLWQCPLSIHPCLVVRWWTSQTVPKATRFVAEYCMNDLKNLSEKVTMLLLNHFVTLRGLVGFGSWVVGIMFLFAPPIHHFRHMKSAEIYFRPVLLCCGSVHVMPLDGLCSSRRSKQCVSLLA